MALYGSRQRYPIWGVHFILAILRGSTSSHESRQAIHHLCLYLTSVDRQADEVPNYEYDIQAKVSERPKILGTVKLVIEQTIIFFDIPCLSSLVELTPRSFVRSHSSANEFEKVILNECRDPSPPLNIQCGVSRSSYKFPVPQVLGEHTVGVQVFIQGQLFGGPYQSLDGFRTGMHNTISNSYWTLDLRSLRVQTRPNSGFARKEERGSYDASQPSEFTSLISGSLKVVEEHSAPYQRFVIFNVDQWTKDKGLEMTLVFADNEEL
ncbi:hypothetical protein C8Q75DRAFT_731308 [Abortiporus biennis]|nr:hypothetical protein C8Q75DRAFT_731308 [Abortiporus biennis]